MQPIPLHWATVHDVRTTLDGREVDLRIHGSSDLSPEDARRDARERLERLIASGGPDGPRESDAEYYPSRRLPEELLEEVLDEDGTLVAAVTRNRYGAAVLNTDALLISDIDLPPERSRPGRSRTSTRAGSSERPGLLSRLFGGARAKGTADLDEGSDIGLPDELGGQADGERGRAHAQILESIRGFGARHPGLGVRAYRTRNGFRLLVSGADAHPSSDRARALMQEVRSDRLYMLLCRVHDTYRARLTPKPWRVDVDRFESLPTRTAADPVHQDWVRRYRDASAQVAVCRLLEVTGPAPSAEEQRIITLHDRATRAESGLPLA